MVIKTVRLASCVLALLVGAGVRPLVAAQSAPAGSPQEIDLNSASVQALETLPGVSAEAASQIVARRPYESIEEFRKKSGLSASQIEKLVPLVTVQPVRQPKLPPGAVPIPVDSFPKGSARPPSPMGRGPLAGGERTVIPVPPGTVRSIPVSPGTVTTGIPVPQGAPSPSQPDGETPSASTPYVVPQGAPSPSQPDGETPSASTPYVVAQGAPSPSQPDGETPSASTPYVIAASALALALVAVLWARRLWSPRKPTK